MNINQKLSTKTKLVGSLVVAGLILFISWKYVQSTPQYSIYEAYAAIRQHDYDTFTKYVDTSSVVDNVVDRIIAEVSKTETPQTGADSFGSAIAAGFIQMMKPMMKEQFKTALQKNIESGDVATNNKLKINFKTFYKAQVKKAGKTAVVTFFTEDNQPVNLHMRSKDGYWQVYDVESPLLSTLKPDKQS